MAKRKTRNKNKSTISRDMKNIFSEGELDENSSVAKNATQLNRFDPRTGKCSDWHGKKHNVNFNIMMSL